MNVKTFYIKPVGYGKVLNAICNTARKFKRKIT